jgi:hypothetical protein
MDRNWRCLKASANIILRIKLLWLDFCLYTSTSSSFQSPWRKKKKIYLYYEIAIKIFKKKGIDIQWMPVNTLVRLQEIYKDATQRYIIKICKAWFSSIRNFLFLKVLKISFFFGYRNIAHVLSPFGRCNKI